MDFEIVVVPARPVTVEVAGQVGFATSVRLLDTCVEVLDIHGPTLHVDLHRVTSFEASGLHALMVIDDQATMRGGHLVVVRPSYCVRRVITGSPRRGRLHVLDDWTAGSATPA